MSEETLTDRPEAPVEGQPQPMIKFDKVQQVVCALHGEVFRAAWPKGYPVFMVSLFQRAMENPALQEAIGGDVKRLPEICDTKPLCTWVSDAVLLELYLECHVGHRGLCEGCMKMAVGTPFRTQEREFFHLCFTCVLHGFKPRI